MLAFALTTFVFFLIFAKSSLTACFYGASFCEYRRNDLNSSIFIVPLMTNRLLVEEEVENIDEGSEAAAAEAEVARKIVCSSGRWRVCLRMDKTSAEVMRRLKITPSRS